MVAAGPRLVVVWVLVVEDARLTALLHDSALALLHSNHGLRRKWIAAHRAVVLILGQVDEAIVWTPILLLHILLLRKGRWILLCWIMLMATDIEASNILLLTCGLIIVAGAAILTRHHDEGIQLISLILIPATSVLAALELDG